MIDPVTATQLLVSSKVGGDLVINGKISDSAPITLGASFCCPKGEAIWTKLERGSGGEDLPMIDVSSLPEPPQRIGGAVAPPMKWSPCAPPQLPGGVVPGPIELPTEAQPITPLPAPTEEWYGAVTHKLDESFLNTLNNGAITLETLRWHVLDIVNMLTFGLFKPELMEIKLAPHQRTELTAFRAEVDCEQDENGQQKIKAVKKLTIEFDSSRLCMTDEELKGEIPYFAAGLKDEASVLKVTQEDFSTQTAVNKVADGESECTTASHRTIVTDANGTVLHDQEDTRTTLRTVEDTKSSSSSVHAAGEDTGDVTVRDTKDVQTQRVLVMQQDARIDHLAGTVDRSEAQGTLVSTEVTDQSVSTCSEKQDGVATADSSGMQGENAVPFHKEGTISAVSTEAGVKHSGDIAELSRLSVTHAQNAIVVDPAKVESKTLKYDETLSTQTAVNKVEDGESECTTASHRTIVTDANGTVLHDQEDTRTTLRTVEDTKSSSSSAHAAGEDTGDVTVRDTKDVQTQRVLVMQQDARIDHLAGTVDRSEAQGTLVSTEVTDQSVSTCSEKQDGVATADAFGMQGENAVPFHKEGTITAVSTEAGVKHSGDIAELSRLSVTHAQNAIVVDPAKVESKTLKYDETLSTQTAVNKVADGESECTTASHRTIVTDANGTVLHDQEDTRTTLRTVEDTKSSSSSVHTTSEDTGWTTVKDTTVQTTKDVQTQRVLVMQQDAHIDHLAGTVERSEARGTLASAEVTDQGVTTSSAEYHKVLWTNLSSMLGKNEGATHVKGSVTTVSTEAEVKHNGDIANMARLSVTKAQQALEVGPATVESSSQKYDDIAKAAEFKDGWITYAPGGSVINLGAKGSLGAEITGTDVAFAVGDVLLTTVTFGTGAALGSAVKGAAIAGTSKLIVQAGAQTAKMVAKQSLKVAAKELPKVGSKAYAREAAMKTAKISIKEVTPEVRATTKEVCVFTKKLPRNNGVWEGLPDKQKISIWHPDVGHIPANSNPMRKTISTMFREYGVPIEDGIKFRRGFADFTPFAREGRSRINAAFPHACRPLEEATITLKGFSTTRAQNFSNAMRIVEKRMGLPEHSLNLKWLSDNGLTIHELPGGRIQFVPSDIHASIPHTGGIAEAKALEAINLSGIAPK